jgi:hypothetical protein
LREDAIQRCGGDEGGEFVEDVGGAARPDRRRRRCDAFKACNALPPDAADFVCDEGEEVDSRSDVAVVLRMLLARAAEANRLRPVSVCPAALDVDARDVDGERPRCVGGNRNVEAQAVIGSAQDVGGLEAGVEVVPTAPLPQRPGHVSVSRLSLRANLAGAGVEVGDALRGRVCVVPSQRHGRLAVASERGRRRQGEAEA